MEGDSPSMSTRFLEILEKGTSHQGTRATLMGIIVLSTIFYSVSKPQTEPDAAGIARYFAQQRAAGYQMTKWDSVGDAKDNPIEL